jgi:hypothetical protein
MSGIEVVQESEFISKFHFLFFFTQVLLITAVGLALKEAKIDLILFRDKLENLRFECLQLLSF